MNEWRDKWLLLPLLFCKNFSAQAQLLCRWEYWNGCDFHETLCYDYQGWIDHENPCLTFLFSDENHTLWICLKDSLFLLLPELIGIKNTFISYPTSFVCLDLAPSQKFVILMLFLLCFRLLLLSQSQSTNSGQNTHIDILILVWYFQLNESYTTRQHEFIAYAWSNSLNLFSQNALWMKISI